MKVCLHFQENICLTDDYWGLPKTKIPVPRSRCPKEGRKSPDTDPLSEQFPWRRFVSDPWPEPLMMATLKSAALSPTVHDQAGGGGADEPAAPPHQPQDLSHQDCPGRAAAAPGQRYLGVTP